VCVADNLWFIALYWAAFSAFCALLSSHMTNKDDDDDNTGEVTWWSLWSSSTYSNHQNSSVLLSYDISHHLHILPTSLALQAVLDVYACLDMCLSILRVCVLSVTRSPN